jgi:hypothetical protein
VGIATTKTPPSTQARPSAAAIGRMTTAPGAMRLA